MLTLISTGDSNKIWLSLCRVSWSWYTQGFVWSLWVFFFHHKGLEVGSQKKPGVTGKFGLGVQNEARQRLIEFCQNALVKANTLFQPHKKRLYTWTSWDGQQQSQTDYILCSQRWRDPIQSAKTRPGADCGSDQEILIAKFRLKLKKVGKTTRPSKYHLNQLINDYTLELRNRFKGLHLIDRVPDELWTEVRDIVQEIGGKTIPKKKYAKKQNCCLRRPYKYLWKEEKPKTKDKGKIYAFECRVPKNSKERIKSSKPFSVISAKK